MTLSSELPIPQVMPNIRLHFHGLSTFQEIHPIRFYTQNTCSSACCKNLSQGLQTSTSSFSKVVATFLELKKISLTNLFLATRHLTQKTGDTTWVVCSRRLARRQLFNHLTTHLKGVSAIFCFSGPEDPKWVQYLLDRRVRFDVPSNEFRFLDRYYSPCS
jgi:hypothetical protein